MSPGKKLSIFIICIATLATGAFFLPLTEWINAVLQWIEANPGISWMVFILLYVIATIFLIPGSILTLSAGFLFNLPIGVILVSFSSVTGACIAFLIGRFLAREWIKERVSHMQRFNLLDQAISKQGFLIVLLTRLSPVFPFNLLNYGLGLTGVRFIHYLLASWAGMLPATIMYVYIGTAAKNLTALFSGDIEAGDTPRGLLFVGLLATVVLTVIITRIATKALKYQLNEQESEA